MLEWHYKGATGEVGPVSRRQLYNLLQQGEISNDSLVRASNAKAWQWVELRSLLLTPEEFGYLSGGKNPLDPERPDTAPKARASWIPPQEKPSARPAPDPAVETTVRNPSPDSQNRKKKTPLEPMRVIGTEADRDGWKDLRPHPWRRYFARMLDILINGYIGFTLFGTVFFWVNAPAATSFFSFLSLHKGGFLIDGFLTVFFSLFLSALMIGVTGGTIGKWIFGIRVLDRNYKTIGIITAFRRELFLWLNGLALGIPLVMFITQATSYFTLQSAKRTSWDQALDLVPVQRPNDARQICLSIAGVILWLTLIRLIGGYLG
ncbi:RDD family protein [Kiloniella laminariae]|uniref:RDD family protein n=1 Tax=Kiloniella laminariae TaxID=454162 RepID=A0ABT4LFJ8_9PROT|nr:RDD family protein [Kiloniella laminariae]MCZ4279875.1 RDD family protein [Kiloniella laminariae]